MDNENEKLLVAYNIWRKLFKMTDDELRLHSRRIRDGNEQHHTIWEMIREAEHDARADMINDLTERMTRLSDIDPEDRCFPRIIQKPDGKFYYESPMH
jgi:hypothetical protein